jgi:hypothetical protein
MANKRTGFRISPDEFPTPHCPIFPVKVASALTHKAASPLSFAFLYLVFQTPTVKVEIRRYSSQYSAHTNGLVVNLMELPDNKTPAK